MSSTTIIQITHHGTPVTSTISASRKWFVVGLEVHYSDKNDPPAGSIFEILTGSADINRGFGGKYVWLVPQWTQNADDAAIHFRMDIRDNAIPGQQDMAAGAGGSYRYLVAIKDIHIDMKIKEVALYRKSNDDGSFKPSDLDYIQARGYSENSTDINANRGKDYLYLIWKKDVAT